MVNRRIAVQFVDTEFKFNLTNKRLNQHDFNFFMLPCPRWGVRGGKKFRINKILAFGFVFIIYKTQLLGIVADTPKVFLQNPSLNFVDIDLYPIIAFFENSYHHIFL